MGAHYNAVILGLAASSENHLLFLAESSPTCARTELPSFPFLVSSSSSVGLPQVSPKPNPGQQHCPEAPVTPYIVLSEKLC